jgi:ring-1,2-phenylacetyl-CoA epoxidase subunit PaaD
VVSAPARKTNVIPVTAIWSWLADVPDPELPVVSVVDLGIVREIAWAADGELLVAITPTYSGCPATEVIADSIRKALQSHGIAKVRLENRLAPAWTTDWLSDSAREKLRQFGITPPAEAANEHVVDASRIFKRQAAAICCPRCGSAKTQLVSQFGSTPCKALYRCNACAEPFDYIKPH